MKALFGVKLGEVGCFLTGRIPRSSDFSNQQRIFTADDITPEFFENSCWKQVTANFFLNSDRKSNRLRLLPIKRLKKPLPFVKSLFFRSMLWSWRCMRISASVVTGNRLLTISSHVFHESWIYESMKFYVSF